MNNGQPFADDDEIISGEIGISLSAWRKVRPALARYFDLSAGTWRNGKLEEVWAATMEKVEKNQRNGTLGGRPKKYHQTEESQQNQSPRKPNGSVLHNPNETNQSQSHNQKEEGSAKERSVRAREAAGQMLEIWRAECGDVLGNPTKASDSRISKCSARLGDHLGGEIENWRGLCQRIRRSWYLTEKWKATIDWVLEPGNMLKIQEGNYDGERNNLPRRASATDNLIEGFGRAAGLGPPDSEPDWAAAGPLLDGEHVKFDA